MADSLMNHDLFSVSPFEKIFATFTLTLNQDFRAELANMESSAAKKLSNDITEAVSTFLLDFCCLCGTSQ